MSEKLCPICGQNNACNVEDAKNCWCMNLTIPQSLLDLVPKEHQSCICADCVQNYMKKMKTPL